MCLSNCMKAQNKGFVRPRCTSTMKTKSWSSTIKTVYIAKLAPSRLLWSTLIGQCQKVEAAQHTQICKLLREWQKLLIFSCIAA
eukprot:m.18127 g.18127  ORF g.18127 m.18127 type:complete len:84 (+) comp6203_c0_seq1:1750-2001(+)